MIQQSLQDTLWEATIFSQLGDAGASEVAVNQVPKPRAFKGGRTGNRTRKGEGMENRLLAAVL